MGLVWKTTRLDRLGWRKMEHWAKEDPLAIYGSLKGKPDEIAGGRPQVSKYSWTPQGGQRPVSLAVRSFSSKEGDALAGALKALVDRKAAVLEMPVAIVRTPFTTTIATYWKEDTRPFEEYVKDPKVPLERKMKTVEGAMRQMAKLFHAGFVHEHPHWLNWRVTPGGDARMIDYTLLRPLHAGDSFNSQDLNQAISSFSHQLWLHHEQVLTQAPEIQKFNERMEGAFYREMKKLQRKPHASHPVAAHEPRLRSGRQPTR